LKGSVKYGEDEATGIDVGDQQEADDANNRKPNVLPYGLVDFCISHADRDGRQNSRLFLFSLPASIVLQFQLG
jgi:hypothetical protein